MLKGKELERKSKHLAFLLRHDKQYNFDRKGWREVSDLIKNFHYTKQELDDIVVWDDKGRFEFNNNKTKIRARQGHSIDVDADLKEKVPSTQLYHGTATRFLDAIYDKGILKMKRTHVHLTESKKIAIENAIRFGKPAIILLDTEQMVKDGIKFYVSRNNVWLTDFVDPKYLKNTEILTEKETEKWKEKFL